MNLPLVFSLITALFLQVLICKVLFFKLGLGYVGATVAIGVSYWLTVVWVGIDKSTYFAWISCGSNLFNWSFLLLASSMNCVLHKIPLNSWNFSIYDAATGVLFIVDCDSTFGTNSLFFGMLEAAVILKDWMLWSNDLVLKTNYCGEFESSSPRFYLRALWSHKVLTKLLFTCSILHFDLEDKIIFGGIGNDTVQDCHSTEFIFQLFIFYSLVSIVIFGSYLACWFGPQHVGSFCFDEERKGQFKDEIFGVLDGSFGTETSCCDGDEKKPCGCQSPFLSPPYVQSVDEVDEVDDDMHRIEACPEVEMPGETNLLCTLKEYFTHNICVPVVEAVQGTKMHQFQGPSDTFPAQQLSSVEEHRFSSPTTIDPTSFDEKSAAAVAVIPKESEFGCTFRDSDKLEDILITGERVFNSDNTGDSEFHQTIVVEEGSVDSLSDGENQDKCWEEYEPKLHNLNAKSCHEQGYSLDEIVEDTRMKCIENMDPASFDENGVAAVTVIPKEHELGCTLRDNDRIDSILTGEARILNFEDTSLLVEDAIPVIKFQQINIVEEVSVDSISDEEKQNKCDKELNSYLNVKSCDEEGNSLDKTVEDTVKSFQVESLNPSVPQEADLKITDKKENQTLQSLVAVTGCFDVEILESRAEEATDKSSSSTFGSNSWSRRGKAASAPQDRTRKSRFMSTSNVDTKVEMSSLKGINIINKSMPKDLFSVLDEEEMFTPNKENSSPPNTFHLKLMKKKGKLEESKHSKSQWSHNLKANFSPKICPVERSTSASSNKENQTPKSAQEWKSQRKPLVCQDIMELKKNRLERRVPLQSLVNSGGNRKIGNSNPFSTAKTIDGATARAGNCGQISDKHTKPSHINGEQKWSWDMVVDTASLLNKESRKALQLLQGLKRTRLIIPQSVIRELGSMKQQYRIFRRTSEAALALEWIEECMENTRWWIHIQSSMEALTPQTQSNGETWDFPIVEDHILDCALQYRTKENVGNIVLLSDDVTLKIKSIAKGLLCEAVQQFRQSLVNPFSQRFMWANSTPRGLTWSCQDDVVLREKYCGLQSKAGLKLITQ